MFCVHRKKSSHIMIKYYKRFAICCVPVYTCVLDGRKTHLRCRHCVMRWIVAVEEKKIYLKKIIWVKINILLSTQYLNPFLFLYGGEWVFVSLDNLEFSKLMRLGSPNRIVVVESKSRSKLDRQLTSIRISTI